MWESGGGKISPSKQPLKDSTGTFHTKELGDGDECNIYQAKQKGKKEGKRKR